MGEHGPNRTSSEALHRIEGQVEALISQQSSLQLHKRAIEKQLASIADQIHEPDVSLTPHSVFLLLEIRGSGGVSEQLEQIARIVHEEGYWKPGGRVQNYRLRDVYLLGRSAQRLFDTFAVIDRCVEQVYAHLWYIKQRWQMGTEASLHAVFTYLAATIESAEVQDEINSLARLIDQAIRPGWYRWLLEMH
ncbi:MAG TPA: hypothetical protein VED37_08275 [Ktedonobacteraceae bacterium]|nr:hypothetical protein [Ktedonobacteraceae bacterium]